MTPHIAQASSICVRYRFAEELAKALRVTEGMRADAIVDGTFIFGDFIEAFVTTHNVFCEKMIISTLSLSQNNVDSLVNLISGGVYWETTADSLSIFLQPRKTQPYPLHL